MKRGYFLLVLSTLAISCTKSPDPAQPVAILDPVISVQGGDLEMAMAMSKARSTLSDFWKHEKKPGPDEDYFAVKVPIKEGEQTEYFWLGDLERNSNQLYGYVANDPELVHNVKLGDRRPITDGEIVDWMYYRNHKVVGNYTIRALFKNMSPEDVKQEKATLATP